MSKPVKFEKRGHAFIGSAAALSFTFGEAVLMAPNLDVLKRIFESLTGAPLDCSLVKESALIAASRVSPDGKVWIAKRSKVTIVPRDEPKGDEGNRNGN